MTDEPTRTAELSGTNDPEYEADFDLIFAALIDAHPGPLYDHDRMCRIFSGWPETKARGCNCSVDRNFAARIAVDRLRAAVARREETQ